jgi:hypothetical protein
MAIKMANFLKHLGAILLMILFLALTVFVTNRAGYVAYGGDGYAHATKINFLINNWPNINWFYFWGNGIPVFLWYALMPYGFLVFFTKLLGTPALAIDAVNILTFFLIGLGVYGTVYEITKSRLAAVMAAFFTIPIPGLWYRVLVGTTPRTFGDGFLALSIWFLVKALKQEAEGKLNPKTILLLTFAVAMAFQTHFFTVLITGFMLLPLIIFGASNWLSRIKFMFLTFLPAACLSAYFLIPFLLTEHLSQASASFGLFDAAPLVVSLLFFHDPQVSVIAGGGLMPIHFSLLLVFLAFIFLKRKTIEGQFTKAIFRGFFFLLLAFLIFGLAIYFGYPATGYNTGFVPDEAFEYLSLVIPILLGILSWQLVPQKVFKIFTMAMMLLVMILTVWQYPPYKNELTAQVSKENDAHSVYDTKLIWQLLKGQETEKNYRYAHPSTEISLWFSLDSTIPQNREFFPHGVMYPNWRSWQENAIYNEEWNKKIDETKFLLDWFSIKWFSLVPGFNATYEKYKNDPDFVIRSSDLDPSIKGATPGQVGFEYLKATPILSTVNSPSVLVVGEKAEDRSYGVWMRVLSTNNLNSQAIIPVRGKIYVDDYKVEELTPFPLVILYEYRFKSPIKAAKVLNDYMDKGGKVLVETTSYLADNQRLMFERALGFESVKEEVTSGIWNFSAEGNLSSGIDFSSFSPARYEEYPWKIYSVESNKYKNVEPILLNNKRLVILGINKGQGKLVWSGLNLPYHTLSYQNEEESKFLIQLIFGLLGKEPKVMVQPENQANFINPQLREVTIKEPASAVLFKENYFFNWHAKLIANGRTKELKIYQGGTDFMYIPFGEQLSEGKVVLTYEKSLMENLSLIFSGLSVVVLLGLYLYWEKRKNGRMAEKG